MWVFAEASRWTRVEMDAWHDGHTSLVEPGPTFTVDSADKKWQNKK